MSTVKLGEGGMVDMCVTTLRHATINIIAWWSSPTFYHASLGMTVL